MERSCPNRRWDFGLLGSVAVHTILGTALLLIPWTRAQNPAESGAYAVAVVVPPTESSDNASGDHRLVDDPQEPIEVIEYADGPNRVPGLDFDIDKLRARREGLFPFLTTDLGFLDRLSEQIRDGSSAPAIPQAVELKTLSTLPPLRLSDEALQQTIDRAWSRRSRWTAFAEIAELTRTHNSDSGQAPSVLSAYLDQNLLQLFCDTSTRVPRLWAMLENAAPITLPSSISSLSSRTIDRRASRQPSSCFSSTSSPRPVVTPCCCCSVSTPSQS
jgi:hypothetical protein